LVERLRVLLQIKGQRAGGASEGGDHEKKKKGDSPPKQPGILEKRKWFFAKGLPKAKKGAPDAS